MITSRDHGVGVGTAGGGASTVNVRSVPGGAGTPEVFTMVNGAGTEKTAGFIVTFWPARAPLALKNAVLPVLQISELPPVNIPIPPSTRRRNKGVEVAEF